MKNRFHGYVFLTVLCTAFVIAMSMMVSACVSFVFCDRAILSDLQQSNYDNEQIMAVGTPVPTPKVDEKVLILRAKAGEVGQKAVCPVMKGNFTVTMATDAAEYKGKTYFFCCPGCAPMFKKNPAKYEK